MQTTSHLLMIRPVGFGFNAETAVNNSFQVKSADGNTQQHARDEFDAFVRMLRSHDLDVTVVDDTPNPHTPDSIFPNNWISFHDDGSVLLYPMYAVNRRAERKRHVIDAITKKFVIQRTIDLSAHEKEHKFLEGTGSMVLDRDARIAYACLSPRTDETILKEFCTKMNYRAVAFDAVDESGQPIYHTNVMMCVAEKYVVICLESIPDDHQREEVVEAITNSGKQLVSIDLSQMNRFAGNMLQVQTSKGIPLLVMSTQAFESLAPDQVETLHQYNEIVHSPLTTIETNGGGSARCMLAEVHLHLRNE